MSAAEKLPAPLLALIDALAAAEVADYMTLRASNGAPTEPPRPNHAPLPALPKAA